MSGANARTTALVTAYVKCISPGAVLLDDELDSSPSCEHQKEGRDGGDGRQTRRHGVVGTAERENMGEQVSGHTICSVGGLLQGEYPASKLSGHTAYELNIPRTNSQPSIRVNNKQAFPAQLYIDR